jgi:hypothetical protein
VKVLHFPTGAHVRSGRRARPRILAAAWRRFWFAPAPPEALGICRMLFFAYMLRLAPEIATTAWASVTRALWLPVHVFAVLGLRPAPPAVLAVLDVVWVAALLLACVGWCTRASAVVAALLGVYLLGLPQCFGKVDHWSGLLILAMLILALARCGDAVSVDAWRAARRARRAGRSPAVPPSGEYRWPIQLVRLTMTLVFFAAGVAKLRFGRAAWFDPANMAAILIQPHYALDRSLPELGLWIARSPAAAAFLAAATVLTEVSAPLALVGGLPALVIIGTLFTMQLGNALLLGVHASFPYLACYAFWLPWGDVVARLGRRGHADASVAAEPWR